MRWAFPRFAACLAAAAFLWPGAASAAPQAIAGPLCGEPGQVCYQFSRDDGLPVTLLKQVFNAPSAGTAVVSVSGAMSCNNRSAASTANNGVVDLTTQIVVNNAAPSAYAPGGQLIGARLPPSAPTADYSNNFALAPTRVVPVVRGPNTFRYKITSNRLDESVFCTIYTAQMSIIFIP